MVKQMAAGSVDQYVASLSPDTRQVVEQLRALIHSTAPGVTERISYGIPTFVLNGQDLLALAGWKKHVSIYPVTRAMVQAFPDQIKTYRTGKGTLQFPLDEPIPTSLIRGIVKARVAEGHRGKPSRRPVRRKFR